MWQLESTFSAPIFGIGICTHVSASLTSRNGACLNLGSLIHSGIERLRLRMPVHDKHGNISAMFLHQIHLVLFPEILTRPWPRSRETVRLGRCQNVQGLVVGQNLEITAEQKIHVPHIRFVRQLRVKFDICQIGPEHLAKTFFDQGLHDIKEFPGRVHEGQLGLDHGEFGQVPPRDPALHPKDGTEVVDSGNAIANRLMTSKMFI